MKKQLLLFSLTVLPLFVYATSGKCGDNVTYDFNETTHILTISGDGPMYDYDSGSNRSPFDSNSKIYEVIINSGVTAIGDKAFWGCSSITSVTIPNSVVRIGKAAFIVCLKLETVDIPNSVVEIGSQAFQGCNSMTSVALPNNISIIEDFAFAKCESLTTISIPNNVTQIKKRAFEDCIGLTEIYIPPSVQSIELRAFNNCSSLNSVHITDLESWCNIIFELGNSVSSNPLYYAHHLYLNSIEVTDLVIPSGIGSIGLGAFEGCTGLKTVEISNGVTSIGQYAFRGCSGITSVKIPTSVTNIVGGAFASCTSLESIYIPSSVTSIGGHAFSGCTSLTSAVLSNGILQLGQGVFSSCSNLTFATFPNTITDLSEWVFSGTSENLILYCYSEDVPLVHENPVGGNSDIFGKKNIDGTLYVPKTSINEYSESEKWNIFNSIEALPELKYMINGEIYKTSTPMVCTPISIESAPIREGYTFSGWSEIPELMPINDITVEGSFTINKYKLIYIVDDEVYKTYEVEYGSTITPEEFPTMDGYLFLGWSVIPEVMPAQDVTIIGTFIQKGDANGDKSVDMKDIDEIVDDIMGKPSELFIEWASDINDDNKVNAADIVKLIEMISSQGLGIESQLYFDNIDGHLVVSSLSCTLNNERNEAIQLTKIELYCNGDLVSYKNYSVNSSSVAAGGSKSCSFDNLSRFSSSTGFSILWHYTANGETFVYRYPLTD